MKVGGNAPITLNAANEVAVECFLGGRITFDRIAAIVSKVLDKRSFQEISSIEDIMANDERARSVAREYCQRDGR
jgi:1-deoxy-D-xylulose-5-phosphate reductoisomerase